MNRNSTAIVEISSARGVGSIFGGVCTTSGCRERPDLLIGRRGSIAAGHGRLADVPSTILVIDPLPTFLFGYHGVPLRRVHLGHFVRRRNRRIAYHTCGAAAMAPAVLFINDAGDDERMLRAKNPDDE